MTKNNRTSNVYKTFKKGLISGFGWTIGATIGFALVSTILVAILNSLGGLPLVGHWLAGIVEATQEALVRRTPILPQ